QVHTASLSNLSAENLAEHERALFIVSTTGEGDAPDSALAFVRKVIDARPSLGHLRYGLLALGDREYRNFCAFGHRMSRWLQEQGARPMFDMIEVDDGDDGALRHWQHNIALAFEMPDLPDWETPAYERWRLIDRRLLNPGSAGAPCYHLELQPAQGTLPHWEAGDIAEIDPFNSHAGGHDPHPHREYSIASLPSDGALHLLVRQMYRPNGELGLGSRWLTRDAAVGQEIMLRIRSNPSFHLPESDAPLILIGNGTGIAGLRALLKARIARDRRRNWLIYGERNAAYDGLYVDELTEWQAAGFVTKLDLVYSRDSSERRYVQHRLADSSAELREWVDAGAYIYVCGSLEGMAPGVHAVLVKTLGEEKVQELMEGGRYRRDVY
ncbi:MAG TPA: flavodoxin domain-containing protein, partial [Steroidobacteraceae bacterium]